MNTMRILHVISSPSAGGAEIFVRDLSLALRKKNVEIFILFLERAEEAGRCPGFQKEFLKTLDQGGIQYDFIGRSARRNPFKGIFKMRKVCKKFRPDFIHAHLYYGLLFAFFSWPFKVIYTHHNIKLKIPPLLYRIFDLRVSSYVGICNACQTLLRSVSARPVIRIENGVDTDRFKISAGKGKKNKSIHFSFVGSLTKQKNIKLLLSAFGFLKCRDFLLSIAGEGPEKNDLLSMTRELGIHDKVIFHGNISNVSLLLRATDVFVMSSLWEGLPIAQIEAAISGLPTIVTNVGGCAEIIHKACNGLVVDSFKPEDYAAALSMMMDDYTLRDSFRRNSEKYGDFYGMDAAARKHLNLYRQ